MLAWEILRHPGNWARGMSGIQGVVSIRINTRLPSFGRIQDGNHWPPQHSTTAPTFQYGNPRMDHRIGDFPSITTHYPFFFSRLYLPSMLDAPSLFPPDSSETLRGLCITNYMAWSGAWYGLGSKSLFSICILSTRALGPVSQSHVLPPRVSTPDPIRS